MKKILNFFKRKSNNWDLKKRKDSKANSGFEKISSNNKIIVKSPHAKRVITENPGIIKSFNSMFSLSRFKNLKGVDSLKEVITLKDGSKVTLSLDKQLKRSINSRVTDTFYIFKIESKKSNQTYFVKYVTENYATRLHGPNEMVALDVIRKAGFNVIPAHFSYVDKATRHSFVFYRFQRKLIDAEKAYKEGILNDKDVLKIRRMLNTAEKKINVYFKKNYKELSISKELRIRDVYPANFKDFEALPVFIDPKSKKLFIYDPIFHHF